jgi:hypothetical protein
MTLPSPHPHDVFGWARDLTTLWRKLSPEERLRLCREGTGWAPDHSRPLGVVNHLFRQAPALYQEITFIRPRDPLTDAWREVGQALPLLPGQITLEVLFLMTHLAGGVRKGSAHPPSEPLWMAWAHQHREGFQEALGWATRGLERKTGGGYRRLGDRRWKAPASLSFSSGSELELLALQVQDRGLLPGWWMDAYLKLLGAYCELFEGQEDRPPKLKSLAVCAEVLRLWEEASPVLFQADRPLPWSADLGDDLSPRGPEREVGALETLPIWAAPS